MTNFMEIAEMIILMEGRVMMQFGVGLELISYLAVWEMIPLTFPH
jgi:hypothetical protein